MTKKLTAFSAVNSNSCSNCGTPYKQGDTVFADKLSDVITGLALCENCANPEPVKFEKKSEVSQKSPSSKKAKKP